MEIKKLGSAAILYLIAFCSAFCQGAESGILTSIGLRAYKASTHSAVVRKSDQTTAVNLFNKKSRYLRSEPLNQILENHVPLELIPSQYSEVINRARGKDDLQLWIPIEHDFGIAVELSPEYVVSEEFVVSTSEGNKMVGREGIHPHYTGRIKGDANSFVSLSVFQDALSMILSTDEGNFNLVQLRGIPNQYLLFNDQHLNGFVPFKCGVMDEPGPYLGNASSTQLNITTRARNRVEVYIEVDYDIYQASGFSVNGTRDWVLGVFRDMASIYERHSISLRLNEILVWTTNNDPFNNIGANFAELDTALKTWSGIRTNFNGDVAHYMGMETGAGFVIGLANSIGEFCDKTGGFGDTDGSSHSSTMGNSVPYIQLDPIAGQMTGFDVPTWTMLGNLHELGHIFGANHTHACKWGQNGTSQIDDCGNVSAITNGIDDNNNGIIDDFIEAEGSSCFFAETPIIPSNGGTLMSYCNFTFAGSPEINLSKGFHSEVSTRMRNVINGSSCIATYNTFCPEVETIELDFSGIWPASSEVLIHDAQITSGNSAQVTAGDQVILYGDFVCPLNASFTVSGNGCSN